MNFTTRRSFLSKSSLLAGSALSFPNSVTAKTKSTIVGEGEHQYEAIHNWPRLPDKYSWQTTHNVAIDKEENLYVIHEGLAAQKEHPCIFVFDSVGKFIRAFGAQFQGGGHGIEVRTEGKNQFLYVTAYQAVKSFAKMTLKGEIVWFRRAPMASGRYADGEDTSTSANWRRQGFLPTNIAFHPSDGSFYLADGYGAHCIHRYDKDAKYLSTFGSPGKADGQFNLPHGLGIDTRAGRAPSICVTDRANGRLQWFDLDGKHLRTLSEPFILPANVDVHGDLLLIPDLSARVTLIDKNDKMIHLGEDENWRKEVLADNKSLRQQPKRWIDGKFIHPHDACFDAQGNIFVAEWVNPGRVTKLRKLS